MNTDVVRVTAEGIQPIASDAVEKRAVAVSPDGAHIAWAQADNLPEGVPYTASTENWSVMLWSGEEPRPVGTGYGPQFLDADTLLFTAADNLSVVALPDGEAEPQPYLGASSIALTAKAAKGILLVPLADRTVYLAYRILAARPLTTEPIGELPGSFHDVVIGEGGLYGLETDDGAQEIVRLRLDSLQDPSRIFTFPGSMQIVSLTP
jgi:hypothetical protein